MDAFFCITLSVLVLRWWWKEQNPKPEVKTRMTIVNSPGSVKESLTEEDKKRNRDIADLKRQGYTDELIAVILPQLNSK